MSAKSETYRPVVLVVDDESAIADTVTEILTLSGYQAIAAYDAEEALENALSNPPQMLITDVMLPGMNGIDLAVRMKRIYPDCRVILFSGHAATSNLMASGRTAGHNFKLLAKPIHPNDLIARVNADFKHSPLPAA